MKTQPITALNPADATLRVRSFYDALARGDAAIHIVTIRCSELYNCSEHPTV